VKEIGEFEWVSDIFQQPMDAAWTVDVIKYITHHSKPLSIFREIVGAASTWEGRKVPTKICQKKSLQNYYCETRFASKVLMLQGYLPLRCAIEALVAHPAHTAWFMHG